MLLLITDTSGKQGSVALARAGERDADEVVVVEVAPLAGGMFSAQLVPQIAALLTRHHLHKADIDAFIVVCGPGSFTGLRVGLAAMKGLAEILQKPIVPVSLLAVLALTSPAQGKIAAVLDAGRDEVYFGEYEIVGESVNILRERLLSKAEFLAAAQGSTVVASDLALITLARQAGLSVVAEAPSVEMIARLGLRKLQAAETVSPEGLEANYMRRSDAEMFVKPSS